MPVRDEIRKQAIAKGFDGVVQNENFNGIETESWAAFHGSQIRKTDHLNARKDKAKK